MYDYRLEGRLREAVFTEDVASLNRIVRSNLLPRQRVAYYFHAAAVNGKLNAVKAFLASRVIHVDHVNIQSNSKSRVTALHEAILSDDASMVKLLLCAGANIEVEASFPAFRADALDLARSRKFEHIVSLIQKYKYWLSSKLYQCVNHLTATRDYVLGAGGRPIHTKKSQNRLELLDEVMDFFRTVRTNIGVIQKHWKVAESLFRREEILALLDDASASINLLVEYYGLDEAELSIYERRLDSKINTCG